ncbi:MAG: hypothetical protein AABW79_01540 [Nanoarchaeota archaeon]
MKRIIKEIQNKSKEFTKENKIILREKQSKIKIIEKEAEKEEEQELTLEQKLEIIKRMRAGALERQQMQINVKKEGKTSNLEQVTTRETPRLSEERREKSEDREERKNSYDGARATTYGPTTGKKDGLTYESKKQEDNKAPTIAQGTREERQAEKAREHEFSTERKETYTPSLADERKKKKSLW